MTPIKMINKLKQISRNVFQKLTRIFNKIIMKVALQSITQDLLMFQVFIRIMKKISYLISKYKKLIKYLKQFQFRNPKE